MRDLQLMSISRLSSYQILIEWMATLIFRLSFAGQVNPASQVLCLPQPYHNRFQSMVRCE